MIHLHLLGWMLGILALLGIIVGLRNPSVILFRLSPSHRTRPLAVACCTGLGLLGVLLAVSSMPPERQHEAVPEAAEPVQMITEPAPADADKINSTPASPEKSPVVSTGERVSKPAQAAPKPLAAKPAESAPSLAQAQARAQEAIITRNRCRTASGYMMAQSYELLTQAEGFRRAGNAAALQDMESRGTARRLPSGIEVPLWDQDLSRGLVKFLIPGEEVLYWTRLEAVQCNI